MASLPFLKQILESTIFNILPLAPYPETEKCLGLRPYDSDMEIKEGYAVMAFDYEVVEAEAQCLFDKGTLAYKRKKNKNKKQDVLADNELAKDFLMSAAEGLVGLQKIAPKFEMPELDLYGVKIDPLKVAKGELNPSKLVQDFMTISSSDKF